MKRSGVWRVGLPALGVMLVAIGSAMAQPYGIDAPQPVGAFIDGAFPATTPGPIGTWSLVDAFPGLSFAGPVRLTHEPNTGSQRIYVVGVNGQIWFFDNDPAVTTKTVFLDIGSRVQVGDDCGMLGFAFHPKWGLAGSPNRGFVYVHYQYTPSPGPNDQDTPSYFRLSRFTVPDGSDVVDPASEQVLIQQFDRSTFHNGGDMFFGPDGFLYVTVGDEGKSLDFYGNSQKIDDRLFGGVLRIDVDRDPTRSHPIRRQPQVISRPAGWPPSFTANYFVPDDNPWLDPAGGLLEEFWAIGLRSPHTMTYDEPSDTIWVGDVGQGRREEVDLIVKGGNYQWAYKEGSLEGYRPMPDPLIGIDSPPVRDYHGGHGHCVIVGPIYRGAEHAGSLYGRLLHGDHVSRRIWALDTTTYDAEFLTLMPRSGDKVGLSGFGVGPDGEVYLLEVNGTGDPDGKVYRLVRDGLVPDPPALLSQTGAFSSLATLTPAPGLLPYDVNAPLWSDRALKQRWIAVPNDGAHDDPTERIAFDEDGPWSFPAGTVMVKHFELPLHEASPTPTRRLETRFLVQGTDGQPYGVTYRWNESETDADLLPGGASATYQIQQEDTSWVDQTWTFPAREDCLACHNPNAGGVLGVNTHQLNGELDYPLSGVADNQLRTLNHLGILDPSLVEASIPSLLRSVALDDDSASPEDRVRSYLDANCAQCHRPGGVAAVFDARYATPLSSQNLIDGPVNGAYGVADARVVAPGDVAASIAHLRASATDGTRMPPLGTSLAHDDALVLLEAWIVALDADGDGVLDSQDNCLGVFNASQHDADLDTYGDSCDCAPSDASAFGAPQEIAGLRVDPDGTLSWVDLLAQTGPGTTYDVFREDGAPLPVGSAPGGVCLDAGLGAASTIDPVVPGPGELFRYLVRATNACADGGWGDASDATPRDAGCP